MSKRIIKDFPDYINLSTLVNAIDAYAKNNGLLVLDIAFSTGVRYYHAIVIYKQQEAS